MLKIPAFAKRQNVCDLTPLFRKDQGNAVRQMEARESFPRASGVQANRTAVAGMRMDRDRPSGEEIQSLSPNHLLLHTLETGLW